MFSLASSFPFREFRAHPEEFILREKEGKIFAEKKGVVTWIKAHLSQYFSWFGDYHLENIAQTVRKIQNIEDETLKSIEKTIVHYNEHHPGAIPSLIIKKSFRRGSLHVNKEKQMLFEKAVTACDLPEIRRLTEDKEVWVDLGDEEGLTALSRAKGCGNEKVSNVLLSLKADEGVAEAILRMKRLAAIWGISERVSYCDQNECPREIRLDGFFSYQTYRILSERLIEFFRVVPVPDVSDKERPVILDAFSSTRSDKTPFVWLQDFSGHTIGLVFHDGKLWVCNRGAGKTGDAIEVYQLPQSETGESIRKTLSSISSLEDFYVFLKKMDLLFGIEQKDQTVGNCSWANAKSTLLAVLTIVLCDKPKAKNVYKLFTTFARQRDLEECFDVPQWINTRLLELILPKLDKNTYLSSDKKSSYRTTISGILQANKSS